ncbi:MAG: ferrochelatase [Myxococcales bacterium]|nr:ferrochelatase [Myxococcales bacterium]
MRYRDETDFDHQRPLATGILLANVGSPSAPTRRALRPYLKRFLSDPRVIEDQGVLWWCVLNLVILNTRPKRSAELYRKIWLDEGSPLLVHAQAQAKAMGERLRATFGGDLHVELGMAYGEPFIASALERLRRANCRRVLVFPLFPQYSATTTASVFDAVTGIFNRARWVPELRMIGDYHAHPAYIAALAASIREHWAANGEPERLLMSFHGLPLRYFRGGDPYHCQCLATGRLLAAELGLDRDRWFLTFQSRFGREEWMHPYTDKTLAEWGAQKVGRVDVVCPGFSSDCLETLEEIAMENRDTFQQAGGGDYHYIPALNQREDHVAALCQVVEPHLHGWVAEPREAIAARVERAAAHPFNR